MARTATAVAAVADKAADSGSKKARASALAFFIAGNLTTPNYQYLLMALEYYSANSATHKIHNFSTEQKTDSRPHRISPS
ncbi:hypothetical protein [Stutzerimonas stutzeri]|uniref:hypothetical protein n=1 Tax=Stutzerimonas stutzeri TaxID=316 RepID=UPI001BCF0B70|nr:hypothetical protein [Stutzerimonas stutzeri]